MTSVFIISEKRRIYFVERIPDFILLSSVTETNFPIVYCLPSHGSGVHKKKCFKVSNIFPE